MLLAVLGCKGEEETAKRDPMTKGPSADEPSAMPSGTGDIRPTLIFGVVPQQTPTKLARLWQPLLDDVGARAGIRLRLETAPDIPTFEARLAEGRYDIAYMNPYHYVVFSQAPGYRLLARERNKRIQGIVVVRMDSPITKLEELAGREVAFPTPAAFAASILPRAHLREADIAIEPVYVSSHDSVYRAVALGLQPAGGGMVRTLEGTEPDIRDKLRVLWRSAGFSPHAIATHPRVEQALVDDLLRALVTTDRTETGLALLHALTLNALEKAADRDWDDIRALNIDAIDTLTGRGRHGRSPPTPDEGPSTAGGETMGDP